MVDTIDLLLQVNDESEDSTRGLQPGEEAVDADGRFNAMIVRNTGDPTTSDTSHKIGTVWVNTTLGRIWKLRALDTGPVARWTIVGFSTGRALPGRTVFVDPLGDGDATTIAGGLAAANALTPTAANPVTIQIAPGTYTESNPITIPTGVQLIGLGGFTSVVASPSTTTTHIFNLEGGSLVSGLTVRGASGSGGIAFRAAGGEATCLVSHCIVQNCETAVLATGTGTQIACESLIIVRVPGEILTTGFRAENGGTITATDPVIAGVNAVAEMTTAVIATGTDSEVVMNSLIAQDATNGLYADDGGLIVSNGARLLRLTNALRIGSTGSGSRILASATDIEDSDTYDFLIESSTGVIDFIGFFSPLKRSITSGGKLLITGVDTNLERAFLGGGAKIEGGVSVGTPGADFIFTDIGDGGPYNLDQFGVEIIEYWSYDASASSGSRFTRFASNGGTMLKDAGDCIYVGGRFQFSALKLVVTTAAVYGAGGIVMEYWNGSTWVQCGMATYGDEEVLTHRANKPLQVVETQLIERAAGINGAWVAADNVTDQIPDWDLGESMYALRLRCTAGLTTAAVFNTGQVRGDDISIHSDGDIILWGKSRGTGAFGREGGLTNQSLVNDANAGILQYSTNFYLSRTRAALDNNTEGQVVFTARLPADIDTATQVRFLITWAPNSNGTGDIEFELIFIDYGTGVTVGALTETRVLKVVAAPGVEDQLTETEILLDLSALSPGRLMAFAVYRNARNTNADDTFPADVIVTQLNVEYRTKRLS